jgi:hypothetical protein
MFNNRIVLWLFVTILSTCSSFNYASTVYWSTAKQNYLDKENNVTIPAGTELIYDSSTGDTIIKKLTVNGIFTCDNTKELVLKVRDVLVSGASAQFNCGNHKKPRTYKFSMLFYPKVVSPIEYGSFLVQNDSTFNMVGVWKSNWTRLLSTANVGATSIDLLTTVNWSVGDEIVVSSSSYAGNHLEILRILTNTTTSGHSVITFENITKQNMFYIPGTPPKTLFYEHWGDSSPEIHDSTYSLENRAEVMNITRTNILKPVYEDGTPLITCAHTYSLSSCQNEFNKKYGTTGITLNTFRGPDIQFGMGSVGKVNIEQTEIRGFGKLGSMGKYPLHWHHVGNTYVDGIRKSYVYGNVIRDSFQRCMTVHQTHGVSIRNNICFNNFGHAFFLEDGNETNNYFDSNIAIGTKVLLRGYQLISSDVLTGSDLRFKSPASYWISNPNNTFTNNVAAGSDGSGFWFALKDDNHKPYVDSDLGDGSKVLMPTAPNKTALGTFTGNIAHSTYIGFTIDGGPNGACFDDNATLDGLQENTRNPGCPSLQNNADETLRRNGDYAVTQTRYQPPTTANFKNLTAYKNRTLGFWNIANDSVIQNSVFADNLMQVAIVFNSTIKDSAFIAQSKKFVPTTESQRINNSDTNVNNIRYTVYDVDNSQSMFKSQDFSGIELYDGPLNLSNISFVNYGTNMVSDNANTLALPLRMFPAASNRSNANQSSGIRFINDESHPAKSSLRADLKHEYGHNHKDNWATGLTDLDGSFLSDTSKAGFTILPKESTSADNLISYNNCTTNTKMKNAIICPSHMSLIFTAFDNRFDLIKTNLTTGASITRVLPTNNLVPNTIVGNHQFNYPSQEATNLKYSISMYEDLDNTSNKQFLSYWQATGEVSPLIEIYQLMRDCSSSNSSGVTVLKASGDTVQVKFNGSTVMNESVNNYKYGSSIWIRCYAPTAYQLINPNSIKSGNFYSQGTAEVYNSDGGYTESLLSVGANGKLQLTTLKGPNRGIAKIYISKQSSLTTPAIYSDTPDLTLDMYNTTYNGTTTLNLKSGLAAGYYRVKIVRSGTKNVNSSGNYLVFEKLWSE